MVCSSYYSEWSLAVQERDRWSIAVYDVRDGGLISFLVCDLKLTLAELERRAKVEADRRRYDARVYLINAEFPPLFMAEAQIVDRRWRAALSEVV